MAKKRIKKIKPGQWTFLTNHSHVLICMHQDPEIRLREVAEKVGITERAVQAIVRELADAKILLIEKIGRRNKYSINYEAPLRHSLEAHKCLDDLLRLVG